jgi:cytochrome c2
VLPFGDGRVLLAVGDHQFDGTHGMPERMPAESLPDERSFPMDPRVSFGKMLLLDPQTGATEVFARGLRNPQGLLHDAQGRIWETEHGPQGGDELNLIERGHNYGWPEVTLGTSYGPTPWPFNPVQGRHAGYTVPRFAWLPSIGVSNVVQAGAEQFPLWEDDLLVTSLIGMTVYRMRIHDGHVTYVEPIEIGERIRDAIELDDGRITLYADTPNTLLILRNGRGAGNSGFESGNDQPLGAIEQTDTEGARLFQSHCGACHSLRGAIGVGPPLDGVMGRKIGSVRGFAFSPELMRADESWNRDRLADYVRAPQDRYANSRMAAVILPDRDMEELITFLEAQQSETVGP